MKSLAALAAAVLLAAPSEPPRWSNAIPPERFQRTGLVPVLFIPQPGIAGACGGAGEPPEGLVIVACTVTLESGARLVVMPDPCPFAEADYYARIMCHEASGHYLSNWSHEE